jgi:hypothetical protein
VEVFMFSTWRKEAKYRRNSARIRLDLFLLEVDPGPGHMIYMPRGTIHQGNCLSDEHSLYINISAYQPNSWTDLLGEVVGFTNCPDIPQLGRPSV